MFLHGFVLHIVFNMVALWYIGRPVEEYLGSLRFALLYLVSGLAGSAGALVADPSGVTVGASGAIFGILGAMLIIEWNATGRFGGAAASLIAINLVFNFASRHDISIGGHIGGLIGGILVTLAFAHCGRGHAAYGQLGGSRSSASSGSRRPAFSSRTGRFAGWRSEPGARGARALPFRDLAAREGDPHGGRLHRPAPAPPSLGEAAARAAQLLRPRRAPAPVRTSCRTRSSATTTR